jgi:DNA-binding NtrC family response regulator
MVMNNVTFAIKPEKLNATTRLARGAMVANQGPQSALYTGATKTAVDDVVQQTAALKTNVDTYTTARAAFVKARTALGTGLLSWDATFDVLVSNGERVCATPADGAGLGLPIVGAKAKYTFAMPISVELTQDIKKNMVRIHVHRAPGMRGSCVEISTDPTNPALWKELDGTGAIHRIPASPPGNLWARAATRSTTAKSEFTTPALLGADPAAFLCFNEGPVRALHRTSGPLFDAGERVFLEAIARIARANPFLPERIEAERAALGPHFVEAGRFWHNGDELLVLRENLRRIRERLGPLLDRARDALARGVAASPGEREVYEIAAIYHLYDTFDERLDTLIGQPAGRVAFYEAFARAHAGYFHLPGNAPEPPEPAHLFAVFFQIRRAFHYILGDLLGGSLPAAGLRAAVWRSIVSADVFRYQRSLYQHADEVPTLITGPTGTGKDVVAHAIAMSRYVAFDPEAQRFVAEHHRTYHPLNLSQFAPALVESELFGHVRGAFTGATVDRAGWLEAVPRGGTLFLDEIGDVAADLQVKLLRVVQNRRYSRVGSREELTFFGKLITATHKDLTAKIGDGTFREDLYYRICADRIVTPSLREQLDEAPGELRRLLRSLVARKKLTGSDVDATTDQVEAWICRKAPPGYAWSGNMRELEDCVVGVLWQDGFAFETRPAAAPLRPEISEEWRPVFEGKLRLHELMDLYVTIMVARMGTTASAAEKLGVDHRQVSRRIDRALLEKLRRR